MKITSKGIVDGRIMDKFGAKGTQFTPNGMSSYSLPVEILDPPKGTVSFALIFDDHDAVPVCGFTWIHWLVADMKRTTLEENESANSKDLIQGVNSYHSCASDLSVEEATGYGGPAPPNEEHTYTLKVFALDRELGLKKGFMLNDLMSAMDGHILAHAKVKGTYSP